MLHVYVYITILILLLLLYYCINIAESNGKLPHLFIPIKTATLVREFAVEDLPLGKTATLVPEIAVKDLPLGRTFGYYIIIIIVRGRRVEKP